MSRNIVWFSCGAASAVAAKLATQKHRKPCEVIYCDTLAFEHPDNMRFLKDVERWIGQEIKIIGSDKYKDIWDVFERTRYLAGVGGARCTVELKKMVRVRYQKPDDNHIFGFTADEQNRIERFRKENPELSAEFILHDSKFTKKECFAAIQRAGIELPMMYRMGYKNNNCIGCVKGQSGYWNKIRVDFPEQFNRMAKMERKLNAALNKRYEGKKRIRVFLDELNPDAGRYESELDIECGVLCIIGDENE